MQDDFFSSLGMACGSGIVGVAIGFVVKGARGVAKSELQIALDDVEKSRAALDKARMTPDKTDDLAAAKQADAAAAHLVAIRRLKGLLDGVAGVDG